MAQLKGNCVGDGAAARLSMLQLKTIVLAIGLSPGECISLIQLSQTDEPIVRCQECLNKGNGLCFQQAIFYTAATNRLTNCTCCSKATTSVLLDNSEM